MAGAAEAARGPPTTPSSPQYHPTPFPPLAPDTSTGLGSAPPRREGARPSDDGARPSDAMRDRPEGDGPKPPASLTSPCGLAASSRPDRVAVRRAARPTGVAAPSTASAWRAGSPASLLSGAVFWVMALQLQGPNSWSGAGTGAGGAHAPPGPLPVPGPSALVSRSGTQSLPGPRAAGGVWGSPHPVRAPTSSRLAQRPASRQCTRLRAVRRRRVVARRLLP